MASLRFTLLEKELKLFKSSLISLQKIGSNLMVQAKPSELHFRTVNSARSAYLSVIYDVKFFHAYDVFNSSDLQAVLLFKNVLSILRTQRVQKAIFDLGQESGMLTVTLSCENGLIKKYQIPTVDDALLLLNVNKDIFPVCLTAEPTSLSKMLSIFHTGVREVSVTAHPEENTSSKKNVQLRSYLDPSKGADNDSLHTMLSMDGDIAFTSFKNTSDSIAEVTFNIKDFRAMLSLCEALSCDIRIFFLNPGHPLVVEAYFNVDQGSTIRADLILSTIPGDPEPTQMEADMDGQGHHPSIAGTGMLAADAPGCDAVDDRWEEGYGAIASTPPHEIPTATPALPAIPGFISASGVGF